jgi:hypothetical protein
MDKDQQKKDYIDRKCTDCPYCNIDFPDHSCKNCRSEMIEESCFEFIRDFVVKNV